jgi:hypothetical protein
MDATGSVRRRRYDDRANIFGGEDFAVYVVAPMDVCDRLDGDGAGHGVGRRTVQLLRSRLNGAQSRHFEEPGLIALGALEIDRISRRTYRIAAIGPPEAGDSIKARGCHQARRWSVRLRVLNVTLQVCEPANQRGMCLAPVLTKRNLCQSRVSYEQRE